MIRRVTEYVLVCDGDRILGSCAEIGGSAFGSTTMADAIESAERYNWQRISKRLWLCPGCAKTYTAQQAATTAKEERP